MALEETALHFATYDETKAPQSAKQNRKKSSEKFKQPLMYEKWKFKLRWEVFRTYGLYKCNLCPSVIIQDIFSQLIFKEKKYTFVFLQGIY